MLHNILSKHSISIYIRSLTLLLAMLFVGQVYSLEIGEVEPNNSCLSPQLINEFELPSSVNGSLDSTPELPDVDFYKFTSIPGQKIVVDLEGASTGSGTLNDPYLGLFNSNCDLLSLNDDFNGLNSRLYFSVPEDGLFILAATTCCDSEFIGGGIGSYLLKLDEFFTINSIEGRLVNATNGGPLPGDDFPYANVQLIACDINGCFDFKANMQTDSDGNFSFQVDQFGNPLPAGSYQIQAFAEGFNQLITEPFTVGSNETFNLGELGLTPLEFVTSISGRVVDEISGEPLSGNAPPYPMVHLERCEEFGCYVVAITNPDDYGHFVFDGIIYNLNPGNYRLIGVAEEYQQKISPQFSAAAFEQIDFGDLILTPLPIQFGTIWPCVIPSGGGMCEYGIDITYRGADRRYVGKAWSIVELYGPPDYRVTRFQVGKRGIRDTNPLRISLKREQNQTISFGLNVPLSVPDGSILCGYINVGKVPDAQFNSQGEHFIFCSIKQNEALIPMTEKEARKKIKNIKNKDRALLKHN